MREPRAPEVNLAQKRASSFGNTTHHSALIGETPGTGNWVRPIHKQATGQRFQGQEAWPLSLHPKRTGTRDLTHGGLSTPGRPLLTILSVAGL